MAPRGRPKKGEVRAKKTTKTGPTQPTRRSTRRLPNIVFDEVISQNVSPPQLHPHVVDTNFQIKIEHDQNPCLSGEAVKEILTFEDACTKTLIEVMQNSVRLPGEALNRSTKSNQLNHTNTNSQSFDFTKSSNKSNTGTKSTTIPNPPGANLIIKQERMSPNKDWIQILSVNTLTPTDTTHLNGVEEAFALGMTLPGLSDELHGPVQKKPRLSTSLKPKQFFQDQNGTDPKQTIETAHYWEPVKRKISSKPPLSVNFFECPKCCQEFGDRKSAETHFQKCNRTFNSNKPKISLFV